jgi:hypothetical protein
MLDTLCLVGATLAFMLLVPRRHDSSVSFDWSRLSRWPWLRRAVLLIEERNRQAAAAEAQSDGDSEDASKGRPLLQRAESVLASFQSDACAPLHRLASRANSDSSRS